MSRFLQIKFEGLSTGSLDSFELSTLSGESLFVTSAKVDIATGEITEVLTTSNTLNYNAVGIDTTNNIWTIPLLPTNMTSPIVLSCNLGDYVFSATECNGFFKRNTVYSGSINISEITEVVQDYKCDLAAMSPNLTVDNTIQVQNITVNCDYNTQLTEDDFEGLKAFLKNQNRKNVDLTLLGLCSDIPNKALEGIDTFNNLSLDYTRSSISVSSAKIGNSAFKGCSSLTIVSLGCPNCKLDDNSFMDCENLQHINNIGCITSVGNSAFKNCVNFVGDDIDNGWLYLPNITYIGDDAFYNCNNIADDICIGEKYSDAKLTYLGAEAFSNDNGSYTEDKDLHVYDSNAEYLTGDKTLDVSGQSYTFSTIYLNGPEYVHDSSSSSDDPTVSVDSANKVSW